MLIVIPGHPMHKPNIRSRSWKKWRRWADNAVREAIAQGVLLGDGREPLALDVACFFAIPRSWSSKKARAHSGQGMRSKPDGNHLWNAVADALYRRDERIVDQRCVKFWDDGGGARTEVWLRAWGGRAEWVTRATYLSPDGPKMGVCPPEVQPCNHIPPGKCYVCSLGILSLGLQRRDFARIDSDLRIDDPISDPKHLLTARRRAR